MRPSNRQRCLAGLLLGACLAIPPTLDAIEFPWARRYPYSVYIPQSSRNDVAPGDYVEIGVVSGPEGHRERQPVAKKVQVIRITDPVQNSVAISLSLTRDDFLSMNRRLAKSSARVYVRIVQKNSRPSPYVTSSDGIPELDLENDDLLAKNSAAIPSSSKPE